MSPSGADRGGVSVNTDIRIACTWPTHPKTKKLIRRLGGGGAFSLVALWGFAAQYHPQGRLDGMDAEDIALAACWDGDPQALVGALVDVGFLDEEGGVYLLHDWAEHQPWVIGAKERTERARAAAQARWAAKEEAQSMPPACSEHATGMRPLQSSNAPLLSSPLLTQEQTDKPSVVGSESDNRSLLCPVKQLVDLYHNAMPDNPRVKVLSDARRKTIAARWKEAATLTCKPFGYATTEAGLDAWRQFFEVCAESAFLTGRTQPQPGKPPFQADIDFLMSPSGFAKCLENKYHREAV